ncbi:hypothetical protein AX17_007228 [Amanita inopinata Kibby_2008]|nr:hypothetical protein AX17_007228 [Amanita inopinata Kibby_2008]
MNQPDKESPTTAPLAAIGLVARSVDDILDPVDPRLSLFSRPSASELDLSLGRQLSRLIPYTRPSNSAVEAGEKHNIGEEPLYIDWRDGDERNPINYPKKVKWMTTAIACYGTLLAASAASAYNLGFESMGRELHSSDEANISGLSVFALGFGLIPLVSASFSEEFGRKPLYIFSSAGFALMYLMVALAKNIETVVVGRFLQGAFGSSAATMVGGTIADIWSPKERGVPMAIFTVAAVGGTGLGPVIGGWIEYNKHLEWRWIQWIQLIYYSTYLILTLFMKETRSGVILTRLAKNIRKETGDNRYRARVEDERASLRTLIKISCTRPVYLAVTEPIVTSFSLWIGFAWGVCYSLIASIPLVFANVHGFNVGEVGTAFVGMVLGTIFGFLMNFWQEAMYNKYHAKRGPEARLYGACVAAVMLPAGMFIYAWTSLPQAHWIGSVIGVILFTWALFSIYNAVFAYLSDCYGPYASSASAGQSLASRLSFLSMT